MNASAKEWLPEIQTNPVKETPQPRVLEVFKDPWPAPKSSLKDKERKKYEAQILRLEAENLKLKNDNSKLKESFYRLTGQMLLS